VATDERTPGQWKQFETSVSGGVIVGWERGEGRPLLLLHGGIITDYTSPLADRLPAGYRIIRYQQRGLGPSTVEAPLDVEAHVRDAVAVLDDRGIDSAWVVGHSWGGHLGFFLAAWHPERVAGLVAVDPLGAVGDGGEVEMERNQQESLEALPDTARRAAEIERRAGPSPWSDEDNNAYWRLSWPPYFGDPHTAPTLDPAIRTAPTASRERWRSTTRHFELGTLAAALPAYKGPFTIIHGELDPLPAAAGRETAELVPGARFELIEGSGHFPWLERPEAFDAAMARAMAS